MKLSIFSDERMSQKVDAVPEKNSNDNRKNYAHQDCSSRIKTRILVLQELYSNQNENVSSNKKNHISSTSHLRIEYF